MKERIDKEYSSVNNWVSGVERSWGNIPEYKVDPERLSHLAIICDGNRRAARARGFDDWQGHRVGVEVIKGIMRASREWEVGYLTFWVWSTENWKREKGQVDFVMSLATNYLHDKELENQLMENGVRFTHLGRKDRLPGRIVEAMGDLEDKTRLNKRYRVNLALDYGGLDEIARAVGKISGEIQVGNLDVDSITKDPTIIYQCLDTQGQLEPDLVIRTGMKEGEIPHTSGFMPLQTGYSGWMFLPDLFPDLTPDTLCDSIGKFVDYKRRFGR